MANEISASSSVEIATFYIGEALCGMDILKIQEINKQMEMTNVPQVSDYVLGILNLRGRIVTVIDIGRKLGLFSSKIDNKSRNIIVNSQNEYIGILVDSISDVVVAEKDQIEPPPSNIGDLQGTYFEGVYKTDKNLIGILDVEQVLKDEHALSE